MDSALDLTRLRDYAERLIAKNGETRAAEIVASAGYDKETVEALMGMILGKNESDVASAMATDGDLDDFYND